MTALHSSKPVQSKTGIAKTRDGIDLKYTVRSTGESKPRIALVHSLAMDSTFWDPVAELLAAMADVLT